MKWWKKKDFVLTDKDNSLFLIDYGNVNSLGFTISFSIKRLLSQKNIKNDRS
tara:strand:- start:319 stop:474 length:156 start_codon:yes stop_codon:yes gene_type:complete